MANPVAGTSIQNPVGTGTIWSDQSITAIGPNYLSFGGANNAVTATLTQITPGAKIAVAAGLRIFGVLANSLQAGNNSLNLNATGVKSIVGVGARNIKTTIPVGAVVDFVYDGTKFQLLNATY